MWFPLKDGEKKNKGPVLISLEASQTKVPISCNQTQMSDQPVVYEVIDVCFASFSL